MKFHPSAAFFFVAFSLVAIPSQAYGGSGDDWSHEPSNYERELTCTPPTGLQIFLYIVIAFVAAVAGLYPFMQLAGIPFYRWWGSRYKTEGETIFGYVTSAEEDVEVTIHHHRDYTSSVSEKTTGRHLTIEYLGIVDKELKIIRKRMPYVSAKTFERPSETGEVELLMLPSEGAFSAYPRDAFFPSKMQRIRIYCGTCLGSIVGIILLAVGMQAILHKDACSPTAGQKAGAFLFFAGILLTDFLVVLLLYKWHVNNVVRGGKVLRQIPENYFEQEQIAVMMKPLQKHFPDYDPESNTPGMFGSYREEAPPEEAPPGADHHFDDYESWSTRAMPGAFTNTAPRAATGGSFNAADQPKPSDQGSSTKGEDDSLLSKPAFQRPVNPKSSVIANGWLEQQRWDDMTAWKDVMLSLIEGRMPGEETTLLIQRNVTNASTGKVELEVLHEIPMKWLEQVRYQERSAENGFMLKVLNIKEEFVFRCPDSEAAENWVLTLLSVQQMSESERDESGHTASSSSFADGSDDGEDEMHAKILKQVVKSKIVKILAVSKKDSLKLSKLRVKVLRALEMDESAAFSKKLFEKAFESATSDGNVVVDEDQRVSLSHNEDEEAGGTQ